MASLARTNKQMRRTESKKSHSWWWDSHISPKNSRWLAENLEEMDQSVKRMLKLIEEDGDSFAKKAEMYYQRRPQLISHVEEFYRMYRSLAERYDHVTGELRKNIPSDLQSQGSGISDIGSELPSALPSSHRKSGPRAAGFDVFLRSGGSSSDLCKEGDDSSTLDSESESDDSSVNNYSGIVGTSDDQGSRRKIIELEVELRDVKEKLRIQQIDNSDGSLKGSRNGNSEDPHAKIAGYIEELRLAKEKIQVSEDEIARLKIELEKYNSRAELESTKKDIETLGVNLEMEKQQVTELEEGIDQTEAGLSKPESNIHAFEEELKLTKEKLHDSETQVAGMRHELENNGSSIQHLKEQLGLAQKDVAVCKAKLDREKREVSKLQDRIVRYKANLLDRDQEIGVLKETISNANQSLAEENSQLQAEISKLLKERSYLENNLKEWELRCQSSEEQIRRINAGKAEMESLLGAEIELLKAGIEERGKHVEELNKSLDAFKVKYDMLVARRDELDAKVLALIAEIQCRDDRIDQMNKHLHQLHMEHVELIGGADKARKLVEKLRSRVGELEEEIERQKVAILEGAEEKREAIRQLCFSLEHYRNGYQQLRQAFGGHKRLPIMAS